MSYNRRDDTPGAMEALGCLVSQMTPAQLEALKTVSKRSGGSKNLNSDVKLMGGLMGVLSTNWKLDAVEVPDHIERGTPAHQEAPKETSSLVPQVKSVVDSAVKSASLEKLVKIVRRGNVPLRIAAAAGGIAMMVTGIMSFLGNTFTLSILEAIYQGYNTFFGLIVVALETRSFFHVLFMKLGIFEYARFLNLTWGRGIFYMYCGSLILGNWDLVGIILGLYMIVIGVIMIIYGRIILNKLKNIQDRFTTEEEIRQIFRHYDVDNSGTLDTKEFASLCEEMGAEFSRGELDTAIRMLDKNFDGLIQFDEFAGWWRAYRGGATAVVGI